MRVGKPVDSDIRASSMSNMPKLAPARAMASNWSSPTERNGQGLPRTDLHIALIARSQAMATALAGVQVVRPPYWPGRVSLHVIISPDMTTDHVMIRQAAVDLGWADSRDLLIGPPAELTLGYPSGTDQ